MEPSSLLFEVKEKFKNIAEENNLLDNEVSILVKTLTPEEAIGNPGRRDFPIVTGKERVIEADFKGSKAHAFTDTPREFIGKIRDIVNLPLADSGERAIFIAAMNAVLKNLDLIKTTIHCKDDEPEQCAKELSEYIDNEFDVKKIGLIGLNPAIMEALVNYFGVENIRVTDLAKDNIDKIKFGVKIWDGRTMTEKLVQESDLIVVTGTTFVNDTFDNIYKAVQNHRKEILIFGVTCSGISELTGIKRICPYGREN